MAGVVHASQRTLQLLGCLEETIFLRKIPCRYTPALVEAHKACFSFTLSKISIWVTTALKSGLCTIPSWSSGLVPITTRSFALSSQRTYIPTPTNHAVAGTCSNQAQVSRAAQQDFSSSPRQAHSVHQAEKMVLGPQIARLSPQSFFCLHLF